MIFFKLFTLIQLKSISIVDDFSLILNTIRVLFHAFILIFPRECVFLEAVSFLKGMN